MYSIKTQCDFEAAHRLYNVDTYSTECRDNIHGHSFSCIIQVSRKSLNPAGMCADFKLIKKVLNDTVFTKYDHSCILRDTDPLVKPISENCKKVNIIHGSPTAEVLAKTFYDELSEALINVDSQLILDWVSVKETEHNIATYSKD